MNTETGRLVDLNCDEIKTAFEKNGKISGIRFCFKFQNTKNQFGFEKRYDIYKAYIDKGYSKAEADRLSDEEWKR